MIYKKYEFSESIYSISKTKMTIILSIVSLVVITIPFL